MRTMLARLLITSILFCCTAAQGKDQQQLNGVSKGVLGAGASVCFVAAGALAYLLWRKPKSRHSWSHSVQLSSPQQLKAQDISLNALARAHDSVTVAKNRQSVGSAAALAAADRIPVDVEVGVRAHYITAHQSKCTSAADNGSLSPTSSTSGSNSAHGIRCVAFEQLTEAQQRRLRADNIVDSVVIAHSRSGNSRAPATLPEDEEDEASTVAETLTVGSNNGSADNNNGYHATGSVAIRPTDMHMEGCPSVRHVHAGLQGEPPGCVSSSDKPAPNCLSRDGQATNDCAKTRKYVQFGDE